MKSIGYAEAAATQFPEPADSDVDQAVASVEANFTKSHPGTSQASQTYAQRLAELQITPDTVRRIVARQIYRCDRQ